MPAASYDRCALRIDRNRIRQGTVARVVGESQLFRPVDLSRLVIGDSARAAGRTFHRNAIRADAAAYSGALLVVSGLAIGVKYHCNPFLEPGNCRGASRVPSTAGRALLIAGAISTTVSFPFDRKATRALSLAIALHNARLSRPAP
jgi:hypothetical protein